MLLSQALNGRVKLYEDGIEHTSFVSVFRKFFEEHWRIMQMFRPWYHGRIIGRQLTEDDRVILRSVKNHCTMAAARAYALGLMLRLNEPERIWLLIAALLHDQHKLEEIHLMEERGISCEAYDEAQTQTQRRWLGLGIEPEVVKIAGAAGHGSLLEMWLICSKHDLGGQLTGLEVCQLAMHLIDDIGMRGDWVGVVASEDGENVIDVRCRNSAANPRYQNLNLRGLEGQRRQLAEMNAGFAAEGKPQFCVFGGDGETAYQAQARIGHVVEAVLARIIAARNRPTPPIAGLDLPVTIDNHLFLLLTGQERAA